jgi:RNA polymerase sigma-70 factor (ECF subfamily)
MLGTYQRHAFSRRFLSQSCCERRYQYVSAGDVETWELRPRTVAAHGAMDYDAEFEAIFLEHYPRVLGILFRLTGNRAQAEDLANDVFWRLSRQRVEWLLTNNVGAWLYRTATHAGIDALRAAKRRTRYEQSASAHETDSVPAAPLAEMLREEDRKTVQSVLASMKASQAQLLLMRADNCSYRELAQALHVASTSVGTLLNRAEAEFRKRYLRATGKKEIL